MNVQLCGLFTDANLHVSICFEFQLCFWCFQDFSFFSRHNGNPTGIIERREQRKMSRQLSTLFSSSFQRSEMLISFLKNKNFQRNYIHSFFIEGMDVLCSVKRHLNMNFSYPLCTKFLLLALFVPLVISVGLVRQWWTSHTFAWKHLNCGFLSCWYSAGITVRQLRELN